MNSGKILLGLNNKTFTCCNLIEKFKMRLEAVFLYMGILYGHLSMSLLRTTANNSTEFCL